MKMCGWRSDMLLCRELIGLWNVDIVDEKYSKVLITALHLKALLNESTKKLLIEKS